MYIVYIHWFSLASYHGYFDGQILKENYLRYHQKKIRQLFRALVTIRSILYEKFPEINNASGDKEDDLENSPKNQWS